MAAAAEATPTAEYQEKGFLLVRRLFSEAELEPWCERLRVVLSGDVAPAERMLVMRDVMVAPPR